MRLLAGFLLLFTTPFIGNGQHAALPDEISEFYHISNFVNAFATTAEKSKLIKGVNLGAMPIMEDEHGRLKTTYQFIQQLDSMILKSRTYQSMYPGDYLSTQLLGIPSLYKVVDWIHTEDEIVVQVASYYLDRGMVSELISDYKLFDKYTFQFGERYQGLLTIRESVDAHRWVMTNNGWMKDPLNKIF